MCYSNYFVLYMCTWYLCISHPFQLMSEVNSVWDPVAGESIVSSTVDISVAVSVSVGRWGFVYQSLSAYRVLSHALTVSLYLFLLKPRVFHLGWIWKQVVDNQ